MGFAPRKAFSCAFLILLLGIALLLPVLGYAVQLGEFRLCVENRFKNTLRVRGVPYLIEEFKAAGAFGKVFLAYRLGTDGQPDRSRPFAVKLHADFRGDPDLEGTGYTAEVRGYHKSGTSRKPVPGLLTFYGVGRIRGIRATVTDYVPGEDLADIAARGPIPERTAIRYMLAAARALGHLHARQLVHRDFKPGNVRIGLDGVARLIDLGTVIQEGVALEKHLKVEVIHGTPPYLDPGYFFNRQLSWRSDLWSFGVSLYELITGRHPYESDEDITSLGTLTQANSLRNGNRGVELSARLSKGTRRVLSRIWGHNIDPVGDPEFKVEPFQSMDEVARELERIAAELPEERLPERSPAAAEGD